MAPAAELHTSSPPTQTHPELAFETAALETTSTPNPTPQASDQRRTTTSTQTRIVTVTLLDSPYPPPLSLSPASPSSLHHPNAKSAWTWPSRSPYPSTYVSSVETVAPTNTNVPQSLSISSTATATSRSSSYPRPSPPSFWYPDRIVPRGAYNEVASLDRTAAENMGRSGNVLLYLPYGLEGLIFMVLLLGIVWTVLTCLLTFPPRTWEKTWWTRVRLRTTGRGERTPLDKPSRYALGLRSSPPSTQPTQDNHQAGTTCSTTHTPSITFSQDQTGLELTRRHQGYRGGNRPFTANQRSRSTPPSELRISLEEQTTSPPNPFLRPPPTGWDEKGEGSGNIIDMSPRAQLDGIGDGIDLEHKSSREWLAASAAFFSSLSPTRCSPTPHINFPSPMSSPDAYAPMDIGDISALEAGIAQPPRIPVRLTPPRQTGHQKSKSWADVGLSKVEDAVNGWVGSLARWTDDSGGDEGLLLPMVRGDGRKEVKVE
ncbi:hypothetical protein EK21DRAFT_93999 [Setomelanomma holmii]|uniref:Uncharacterized protein n=1 Tax=Setomelanomma holmii TaxID=210430 RepID=A0A9P4LGS9_9PLEO|nr:hypothetical protein EK21DRAFT_93999 [Setomelanomma holmii]